MAAVKGGNATEYGVIFEGSYDSFQASSHLRSGRCGESGVAR